MSQEAQKPAQNEIPLIVQYRAQLAMFEKQRDDTKMQFHQLEGAIFCCKQMITQYEENLKKTVVGLKEKTIDSLTPKENMGDIKDGEANKQAEKQVAQK